MSPDGSKSIPPEERLLRLIRGHRPAAEGAGEQAPGPSESRQGPEAARPAAGGVSGAMESLGTRRPVWTWTLPSWWLAAVNWSLGGLVVAEVVMLLVIATRPAPQPPAVEVALQTREAVAPDGAPAIEEQAGGVGLTGVAGRPLFASLHPAAQAGGARAPLAMSQEAKALAARLNVIGVVDGHPPQAIIEDAQTHKTYFVSEGQHVTEGLIVTEIRENRVVLDLNGQPIELSL